VFERLAELFEDDSGRLSMTRLLMFLSFWPASIVLIANRHSISAAEILGIYLGAFVLGYLGGKAADKYGIGREKGPAPIIQAQGDITNVATTQTLSR
jgi:hypothetical protein